MAHPKLRRAAAFALVLALSLLPVSTANAATRARTHAHQAVSFEVAAWLENLLVGALAKAGLQIDPNGAEASIGH